jgi:hypothetical protein
VAALTIPLNEDRRRPNLGDQPARRPKPGYGDCRGGQSGKENGLTLGHVEDGQNQLVAAEFVRDAAQDALDEEGA